MSKIDDLKAEIERLPSNEFVELFQWISEKDWEDWDRQIQKDSVGGKLDFLIQEASQEKSNRKLQGL